MQLLGESLSNIRKKCTLVPCRLSLVTAYATGIQCLQAIKCLHNIGYLHRDIKPGKKFDPYLSEKKEIESIHFLGNFSVGLGAQIKTVYIIDFGMARKYVHSNGEHRDERAYGGFRYVTLKIILSLR